MLKRSQFRSQEQESEEVKVKIIDLVNILFGFLPEPEIDQLVDMRSGGKLEALKVNHYKNSFSESDRGHNHHSEDYYQDYQIS